MTRRQGESRLRWLKYIAGTFVLRGFPTFRTGDHVAIIDDAARTILGDDTGTVKEVVAPFYGWGIQGRRRRTRRRQLAAERPT